MRILAFEDSYDIEALLSAGNIDTRQFTIEQKWNSEDALSVIKEFAPDVLMLDHFMPPMKGLDVLKAVMIAVEKEELVPFEPDCPGLTPPAPPPPTVIT